MVDVGRSKKATMYDCQLRWNKFDVDTVRHHPVDSSGSPPDKSVTVIEGGGVLSAHRQRTARYHECI
jgi:hypothetical protein